MSQDTSRGGLSYRRSIRGTRCLHGFDDLLGCCHAQFLDLVAVEERGQFDIMLSGLGKDLRIGRDFLVEELIALKVVLAEVVLDLTDEIGV